MELVPILSTIILVGTLATFLLAIIAYILYKARERKSREAASDRRHQEPSYRMRQPALAQRQPAASLGMRQGAGQPQSSMYITPTTTLPPQGPVVEVDEVQEARVPQQGWAQPAVQQAQAAPQYRRGGDGHGQQQAPQLQAPQPQQTIQSRQPARQPVAAGQGPGDSSLFWEYTDEGFVPVDPRARQQQQRQEQPPRQEDDNTAWL